MGSSTPRNNEGCGMSAFVGVVADIQKNMRQIQQDLDALKQESGKNATPIQKTSGPESNTVHPDSRIPELKKWVQHALARKLEAQQAEFTKIVAEELRYVRQDIEKERLIHDAQIVALQAKIEELETDAIASTAELYLWRNEVRNLRSQLPPVPLCTPAEVEPVAPPCTSAEHAPIRPQCAPIQVEPSAPPPSNPQGYETVSLTGSAPHGNPKVGSERGVFFGA